MVGSVYRHPVDAPEDTEEETVKTKRFSLLALLAALAMIVAACGGEEAATETTVAETAETTVAAETTTTAAAETTTTEAAPAAELLVWADENRAAVIESVAPAFTEATGVGVTVEIVDFGQIKDQVGVAGPAGEGPDVFVGAHDWTGELAANGAIDPIDLGGKSGDFFEVALDAFNFEGNLYAVPYATEAVAMYYNTDLVAEAPATFEDLAAACETGGAANCVVIPGGGDAGDAYHNYPFVSVLGGYIFAYDPATGYDPSDVGLDSEGAVAGVQFLADQVEAGVVESTNYDNAANLFLEGNAAFWVTGPWELGRLNEQTTVNWAVAKLPTVNGETPKPFVGAQGMFLSAFSENKLVATSFLLDFVATEETMTALYEADPRNPAFVPTFDTLADNPVAQTFAASAADGNPMPNIPQMGSVWGPMGDNILLVRNGEATAADAMAAAAEAVRAALAG
jgi:arabinogalactan oligomer / maltooligosaccharide transport system substrate-binding protein